MNFGNAKNSKIPLKMLLIQELTSKYLQDPEIHNQMPNKRKATYFPLKFTKGFVNIAKSPDVFPFKGLI